MHHYKTNTDQDETHIIVLYIHYEKHTSPWNTLNTHIGMKHTLQKTTYVRIYKNMTRVHSSTHMCSRRIQHFVWYTTDLQSKGERKMHHIKQSSRVMMVLVPRGWGEIKTDSEKAQGCKYISEFEQVLFEIWTNTLLCIAEWWWFLYNAVGD